MYQKKLGDIIPEVFEASPLTKVKNAMAVAQGNAPKPTSSELGIYNSRYNQDYDNLNDNVLKAKCQGIA